MKEPRVLTRGIKDSEICPRPPKGDAQQLEYQFVCLMMCDPFGVGCLEDITLRGSRPAVKHSVTPLGSHCGGYCAIFDIVAKNKGKSDFSSVFS